MKTCYVLGFMFSADREWVTLIRKQRPVWQAGKFNGVGGHVEPGESARMTMVREFREETGVRWEDWECVAVLSGDTVHISVFAAFTDGIFNVDTMTDEQVVLMRVSDALQLGDGDETLQNFRILMAVALDQSGLRKPVILHDKSL